jgi:hypothetical protein
MEATPQKHLDRIKYHLKLGRYILETLNETDIRAYDVPDVQLDSTVLASDLPREEHKYVTLFKAYACF